MMKNKIQNIVSYLAVLMLCVAFAVLPISAASSEGTVKLDTLIHEPTTIVFCAVETGETVEYKLDDSTGYDITIQLPIGDWMIVSSDDRAVPEEVFTVGENEVQLSIGFNSVSIVEQEEEPAGTVAEEHPDEPEEKNSGFQHFFKVYQKVTLVVTLAIAAVGIFVIYRYKKG